MAQASHRSDEPPSSKKQRLLTDMFRNSGLERVGISNADSSIVMNMCCVSPTTESSNDEINDRSITESISTICPSAISTSNYQVGIEVEPGEIHEESAASGYDAESVISSTIASSSQEVMFDIGNVDFSTTLTDSEKYSILTVKFIPDKTWKGPQRVIGKSIRRVPSSLFNESRSALSYSVKRDGVFCAPCSVFAKTDELFVRLCHNDWSNIEKHVQRHLKCKSHFSAVEAAAEFLKVCNNKQGSVQTQLSKAYSDKVQRNRSALESVIKTIVLCGRQNIPLRGHTDDRSNFNALLEYRSECDDSLRTHLETCPRNAKYISHDIQNELIQICGEQILASVLDECRKARFFTVIVDETTDISVKEQVSIVLLYINSEGMRQEKFVGFQETSDTTGETLYKLICDKLLEFGLDKHKVIGLGFDGAANMSGKFKGVQARFLVDIPEAQYVHCRAHCLNLAIMTTCQLREVRNMYGTVSDVVTFIQSSAKRMQVFRANAELGELDRNLKKFCATRWTCHEETLSSFLQNLTVVIDTLQMLTEDSSTKTCSTATSLLNSIHNFQFLTSLVIAEYYLKFTKPLSKIFQSPDCDLIRATDDATDLVNFLDTRRGSDSHFVEVFDKVKLAAAQIDVEPQTPRSCGRQTHRSNAIVNTGDTSSENISTYYKINLHHPFLDHLIAELKSRVLSAVKRVQAHHLLPERLPQLTETIWSDIKVTYSSFIDVNEIDAELERWRYKFRDMREFAQCHRTLEFCTQITRDLYPNIHSIFLVLLTMPVSTASAERSFSCLKRLKSYLRSTMGAERLNGLALLHSHHGTTVDVEAVLKKFDSSGHRRIALAFSRE